MRQCHLLPQPGLLEASVQTGPSPRALLSQLYGLSSFHSCSFTPADRPSLTTCHRRLPHLATLSSWPLSLTGISTFTSFPINCPQSKTKFSEGRGPTALPMWYFQNQRQY